MARSTEKDASMVYGTIDIIMQLVEIKELSLLVKEHQTL